jgi:lysophospholipase L1-like esterase
MNNLPFRKKLLYSCLMLFISAIVIIFSGEVMVRIFRPQFTYSELKGQVGSFYAPAKFNTFTLKENYSGYQPSMEFPGTKVKITTNSMGLRGREIQEAKPCGFKRILILGDSYTFGVYVNDAETYPAVLEKILTGQGYKVEVLNAAYADGYETDDIYCWLVNEGRKFKPDIIIYGLFAGNDITGIKPKDWASLDQRQLPKKIDHKDLYVDNFGSLRAKAKDYKSVGEEDIYRIPVLRESQLMIYLFKKILFCCTHDDGYHMKYFPQYFRKSDKNFDYQEDIFLKLVKGMKEESQEEGATFIVLMIPMNWEVEPERFIPKIFPREIKDGIKVEIMRNYYDELKPKLKAIGVEYIDILDEMKRHPEKKYFPKNGEVHFNPEGHRFAATCIKETLLKHGLLNLPFNSISLPSR